MGTERALESRLFQFLSSGPFAELAAELAVGELGGVLGQFWYSFGAAFRLEWASRRISRGGGSAGFPYSLEGLSLTVVGKYFQPGANFSRPTCTST